jgi:hypothetical protein
MLRMRIVRAPLRDEENQAILHEYNRLTGGQIPLPEFAHWTTKSPDGPSWHAILETEEGRIVGHTSVFPLRIKNRGAKLIPAKSEYSFLHEDFRKEKIQGYEIAGRPAFIILLDRLFQHCQEQGWGPIFASTNEKNQVFTRKVGLRPIEFPLWECLLVLRPGNAARHTPNLTKWQRAALYSAGLAHGAVWPVAATLLASANGIKNVPVASIALDGSSAELESEVKLFSFFEDRESLAWRYLEGQYLRFGFERSSQSQQRSGDYLIAKRGSPYGYLRVCQWKLDSVDSFLPLFGALVREARNQNALGVRWAVYDGESASERLVKKMRRAGFLCARRNRIVMIHKKDEKYLDPAQWRINDSLFSFDP